MNMENTEETQETQELIKMDFMQQCETILGMKHEFFKDIEHPLVEEQIRYMEFLQKSMNIIISGNTRRLLDLKIYLNS